MSPKANSTPQMASLDPSWNITDFLERNVRNRPKAQGYMRKVSATHWASITWEEFRSEVIAIAKGLIATGLKPGDHVGIMSRTRYEWTLFDISCWYAGLVTVPIYETSSAEQIVYIAKDAGLRAIMTEDDPTEQRVNDVLDSLPDLDKVWAFEKGSLAALIESGKEIGDDVVEERRSGAGLADLATIIYTSGTTGNPKGCRITHGNLSLLSENTFVRLKDLVMMDDGVTPGRTLLFITLAHVFARYVQVLCLAAAAPMGHTSDMKDVSTDIKQVHPTFLLSVPRVFEKIYNSAEQTAKGAGRGALFTAAAKVAVAYSRGMDEGKIPLLVRAQHAVFNKLVYSRLRAALGGECKFAVSGSAPLGTRLAHFFRAAGIIVLEGYGLTESTAPACVNVPEDVHIGTVGFPLPGCEVRIADDGEILLRGVNIFDGYHNKPEETEAAFVDGWLHTGDIGSLSDVGALSITGRKKEILITAGGKNVAPAILEDRMRMHPLISQAIVVGDAKPFIAALVTLDAEMLPSWCKGEGIEELSVNQAVKHPKVIASVEAAVQDANKQVSRAESIRKHTLLTVDFSVASGHLTPSLKLKRSVIMRDFATDVENLYSS